MPPKPWTLRSSEYLIQDTWLTVRADRLNLPNGQKISPYYILEYADWTHVVPVDEDGRILMIRQYRPGREVVSIEVPGGVIDPEDASPMEAARRELLEETGYAAETLEPLGAYAPNPASHNNLVHCFLARGLKKVAEPDLDATEDIESEWVEPARLLEMIDSAEMTHFLHVPTVLLALRRMGSLIPAP